MDQVEEGEPRCSCTGQKETPLKPVLDAEVLRPGSPHNLVDMYIEFFQAIPKAAL